VIPILYQKGMSLFPAINTNADIYLLRINAIGSKKGTQQDRKVLAVASAVEKSLFGCLPVVPSPPLLITFITYIVHNPVSNSVKASLGDFQGGRANNIV
jgi:hypothetical protein